MKKTEKQLSEAAICAAAAASASAASASAGLAAAFISRPVVGNIVATAGDSISDRNGWDNSISNAKYRNGQGWINWGRVRRWGAGVWDWRWPTG